MKRYKDEEGKWAWTFEEKIVTRPSEKKEEPKKPVKKPVKKGKK